MRGALLAFVVVGAAACNEATEDGGAKTACAADTECAAGTERCDVAQKICVAIPPAAAIGTGDGSATSVAFTQIAKLPAAAGIIDLAFNPNDEAELWTVGYADDSIHVGSGVGGAAPTWQRYKDPAALHFMHKPTAIAMGDNGFWGTCGNGDNSAANANRLPNYFMGPALFTLDRTILAKPTPGGLGSHFDMLHSTSFCRGVAHVQANRYWAFNAMEGSLELYDFHMDHGPGADDHSDGEIFRYVPKQLAGVDDVPSHLAFDASDGFLYVADTGHARIVKLDTANKGTKVAELRRNEPLAASGVMGGVDLQVVVAPGNGLAKPSGLEIFGGLIYVSDTDTSTFHAFDKSGKSMRKLTTTLPPGSLAGFTFGPDRRLWFVDRITSTIYRIDPALP